MSTSAEQLFYNDLVDKNPMEYIDAEVPSNKSWIESERIKHGSGLSTDIPRDVLEAKAASNFMANSKILITSNPAYATSTPQEQYTALNNKWNGVEEEEVTPVAVPTLAEVQPPAAVEKVTVNPYKGLLDLIAKGEGDYNSSNRGTLKNKILGSTHNTKRDNKSLTEMTIAEIKVKQAITDPNDKDRLFAIGRYQLIPTTFNMAVKSLGIDENTKFTEDVQDKFGEWLIKGKRPNLGDYLNGESDDRDAALLDLAMEWASIPVAKDTKRNNKTYFKGKSYHGGGNKAHHTVEEVEAALDAISRPKVIKDKEPATRGAAFKAARKRGDKTFMYKGKKFTTEMA
tara:strand:- start:869 stop:1894 length:1026 start_codon:yes stop_codon:yes gene_type:complete